jgi:MinD-like ATPase involved in chromosome partitioning or flagellar assembly
MRPRPPARLGAGPRVAVLLAGGNAPWEPEALTRLRDAAPGVVLVKRCLDLADLLATAATGAAEVAVVAGGLPGLDADALAGLTRHGVRTVVVRGQPAGPATDGLDERTRLLRMGVARVLDDGVLDTLVDHVRDAARQEPAREDPPRPEGAADLVLPATGEDGRLVAVWGPAGAPGRTTVAIGLAAEAARRGRGVTLLDADPYGGAVAQQLAVLEEISGLLAATRLANTGQLDEAGLAGLAREVSPGLRLLTGLPRPDRWAEVRPRAFSDLLGCARRLDGLVVVDTGFGLPDGTADAFDAGPGRDDTTAAVAEEADAVVVVGSADPVGLTRLARGLRDLAELRPEGPAVVVVNRMRPALGWSEREVRQLVEGYVPRAAVRFLPQDGAAADRALVAGRALTECGDSALRRALAAVADAVLEEQPAAAVGGRSRWLRR